jgi:hypothetical protein
VGRAETPDRHGAHVYLKNLAATFHSNEGTCVAFTVEGSLDPASRARATDLQSSHSPRGQKLGRRVATGAKGDFMRKEKVVAEDAANASAVVKIRAKKFLAHVRKTPHCVTCRCTRAPSVLGWVPTAQARAVLVLRVPPAAPSDHGAVGKVRVREGSRVSCARRDHSDFNVSLIDPAHRFPALPVLPQRAAGTHPRDDPRRLARHNMRQPAAVFATNREGEVRWMA